MIIDTITLEKNALKYRARLNSLSEIETTLFSSSSGVNFLESYMDYSLPRRGKPMVAGVQNSIIKNYQSYFLFNINYFKEINKNFSSLETISNKKIKNLKSKYFGIKDEINSAYKKIKSDFTYVEEKSFFFQRIIKDMKSLYDEKKKETIDSNYFAETREGFIESAYRNTERINPTRCLVGGNSTINVFENIQKSDPSNVLKENKRFN